MTPYLVHIGYVLQLSALLSRDILWLRSLLIVAQSILAAYAWLMGVHPIAAWNVTFVCINIVWVVIILRQRRAVKLPQDLEDLHRRHFAALSPPEFLRLWRRGRMDTIAAGSALTHFGQFPDSLSFLMSGHVVVRRGADDVTTLEPGYFVGEMSVLTGEPSTADAVAAEPVRAMRWPSRDLASIRHSDPPLWAKIQSVLGHDLVEKIKRSGQR